MKNAHARLAYGGGLDVRYARVLRETFDEPLGFCRGLGAVAVVLMIIIPVPRSCWTP
jgi:hypothetical protein